MQKPLEPNKEDCCNSGCNPCIFDVYEKHLKQYEKYLENGNSFDGSQENGIAQLEYTKFIVTKNVNISKSHNLILLKRASQEPKKVWWKPGDHFLFKYNLNEVSCTRAYTPIIISNEPRNNYDFSIVVKKYNNGLISNYLHNLDVGSATLWRGPYGHYDIKPNTFNRIIMIAQGTGIAPFITIIDNILNNEDDMTRLILLYCCKCEDTILFRNELYEYKSYWNFDYMIYLSDGMTNVNLRFKEPIIHSKLSIGDLHNYKPDIKDQFLICGSVQFNENHNTILRKEFPIVENIVLF